jgi:hypothetical protein
LELGVLLTTPSGVDFVIFLDRGHDHDHVVLGSRTLFLE